MWRPGPRPRQGCFSRASATEDPEQDPSAQLPRAFRESRVANRPTVQHVGHPRKLTNAPASGAKVHQPSLDEHSTATVSNPKPTTPRKKCSMVFRLCNI